MLDWKDNLAEVEQHLKRLDQELVRGVQQAVGEAVDAGAAEARQTHDFRNRTGGVERGIRGRVVSLTARGAEGVIEATDEASSHLAYGTRAHEIRPKNAAALNFSIAGRTVFAARVQHPGTKADPFMANAARRAERVLRQSILATLERIHRKI